MTGSNSGEGSLAALSLNSMQLAIISLKVPKQFKKKKKKNQILSYCLGKAVSVFCLKRKISITSNPIGLPIFGNLLEMVLGYFVLRFKCGDGLCYFSTPSITAPLDSRGVGCY